MGRGLVWEFVFFKGVISGVGRSWVVVVVFFLGWGRRLGRRGGYREFDF